MRRTILLLAGVLLSVVALGSDSPKEYDDAQTETLPRDMVSAWLRTVWVGKDEYEIGILFRTKDSGQLHVYGPIRRVGNKTHGSFVGAGFGYRLDTEYGHHVIRLDGCLAVPDKKASFLYGFKDGRLILYSGQVEIGEGKKVPFAGQWTQNKDWRP
jgi:hypothetical protein